MDTIFALASGAGKAGVSVVRISGTRAFHIAEKLCAVLPPPRTVALRTLKGPSGDHLDDALVCCFAGPQSFTGEDVVELHLHGSVAVVNTVLAALGTYQDARLALPGEFTRRALENGKMDLTQVEALADLIDAETEAQRVQAQKVLSGSFAMTIESWRRDLIEAVGLLEAVIDFADEDVPVDVTADVTNLINGVLEVIRRERRGVGIAERIRHGFEVAIVGAPNSGKSTLLNAIAGREAAITSEIAGTTRDVIEVKMDLGGLAVTILDTAGVRETQDVLEKAGVDRGRARAAAADLRVFLMDEGDDFGIARMPGDVVVLPKGDLRESMKGAVSGKTGDGVHRLITEITSRLGTRVSGAGLATRYRHAEAMQKAEGLLERGLEILAEGPDRYDIASEELRTAIRALESLIGRVDVENVLDEIFGRFCLGK